MCAPTPARNGISVPIVTPISCALERRFGRSEKAAVPYSQVLWSNFLRYALRLSSPTTSCASLVQPLAVVDVWRPLQPLHNHYCSPCTKRWQNICLCAVVHHCNTHMCINTHVPACSKHKLGCSCLHSACSHRRPFKYAKCFLFPTHPLPHSTHLAGSLMITGEARAGPA